MDLWTKFYNHLLNEGVTQKRIKKLKQMYNTSSRYIKDFEKADRSKIEKFITALHKDEFKKRNNTPFSGSSKSDIKKFLKQFYKWLKGNNEAYPPEVSWIKTKIAKDEKPQEKAVIDISGVQKLANSFIKQEYKIATLILFDSGFRIQELLSVKKKDLTWEDYDSGKKCFWLACNESKTICRKVPIPLFTEDIQTFLNSSYCSSKKDNDLLFSFSYDNYRNVLKTRGKTVLNIKLSPHALRHSSATYYAKALDGNSMAICQRYGWAFNSKEVALYIRRSGAYQKQSAKKIFENDIIKLKQEMEEMKREHTKQIDEIKKILKVISIGKTNKNKSKK